MISSRNTRQIRYRHRRMWVVGFVQGLGILRVDVMNVKHGRLLEERSSFRLSDEILHLKTLNSNLSCYFKLSKSLSTPLPICAQKKCCHFYVCVFLSSCGSLLTCGRHVLFWNSVYQAFLHPLLYSNLL